MAAPQSQTPSGHIGRLLAMRRNYRADVLAMTGASRYVAFYGCGAIFGSILETWNELVGRKIDFCSDSNPAKWGKTFHGVPCVPPSELEKIKDELAVFVTVGEFDSVLADLAAKGFPRVNLIYKYDLLSSDFLSRQNPDEVCTRLEEVRGMLADVRSVQVFDTILDRLLDPGAAPGIMAGVCEGDQYFPSGLIRLREDESLVDAGAFTGDTVADFLKRTGGRFEAIHCFELNSANFSALQKSVSEIPGADRIFLYPEGLWNEPCEITYSVELSQSTIGAGEAKGKVGRLDDLLGNRRVTILKMDIEGAERNALEGAKRTILSNRPKLAVCVYHHFKDLWEIPLFLRSLVPSYRIYLRHHTRLEYETVCYALPPEDVAP